MFSVSGGEYIIIFKRLLGASRVSFAFAKVRNLFREICYYMRADRTTYGMYAGVDIPCKFELCVYALAVSWMYGPGYSGGL